MPFLFKKLLVYQKAVDFAEAISKICDGFSKGNYYLSDQLNRASLSISANIAEGNGRWHSKDRKQYFWVARGSAQECVPLLEICARKNLLKADMHEKLERDIDEILRMIYGLIQGLDGVNKVKDTLL